MILTSNQLYPLACLFACLVFLVFRFLIFFIVIIICECAFFVVVVLCLFVCFGGGGWGWGVLYNRDGHGYTER